MKKILSVLMLCATTAAAAQSITGSTPQIKTANGVLQGVTEASGVHSFKGIPYALPPIGNLRWTAPQAPKNWTGIRPADHFGPQAMQIYFFHDMLFRSAGKSEDCLYLNVWTPAKAATDKLPVLVYFYGGGFVAGDGSEYRYDGEALAKKGVITVTLNYRLGVFGFMAHPELTKESAHHSSGNYGLMDQHAALLWVQKNIAAFGGDPTRVTIGGESAGAMSVSGQLASPLSKGLFASAIAESGSLLGNLAPISLADGEANGGKFAAQVGARSLADLRKIPADSLLQQTTNSRFSPVVDGYFLPEMPQAIFAAGKQMDVPLLGGWNSAESNHHAVLSKDAPTVENYKNALKKLYNERVNEALQAYPAATDADVAQAATNLASDRFISYASWKMADVHSKTSKKPVYAYIFARIRQPLVAPAEKAIGASHSSEIEYALGNLPYNKVYNWTEDDYKVSETMQNYFVNFIKTGNPNGAGLNKWDTFQSTSRKLMMIDVNSQSQPETDVNRYVFMDSFYK
jgi:para-nitrobenzyl esterase